MKNLSLAKARDLIKRELGVSASSLTAPEDMNDNPEYRWYSMSSGTQRIEVYTNDITQGKYTDKMIALSVTHENSSKGTTEYFYGDTLEYAAPYTDWKNREIFCENMENPENDTILRRLKHEALDDCWGHFHIKRAPSQIDFESGTTLIVKDNHAVFDRYDGFFRSNPKFAEYAQDFVYDAIPAENAVLVFIGTGDIPRNRGAVYVLQDTKSKQVYLYDAKHKKGLEVLQHTDRVNQEPERNTRLQDRIDSAIAQSPEPQEGPSMSFGEMQL